jgi:hypothetical protein
MDSNRVQNPHDPEATCAVKLVFYSSDAIFRKKVRNPSEIRILIRDEIEM